MLHLSIAATAFAAQRGAAEAPAIVARWREWAHRHFNRRPASTYESEAAEATVNSVMSSSVTPLRMVITL